MERFDVAIVGGGIVGLATAYNLQQRYAQLSVAVLEKEDGPAKHQTGHNSGVLHSGIYYKPGSLKATNCRAGKEAMERFCSEHEIPFDICGKVIVAVGESEIPLMERIYERGQANGVKCEIIDRQRLTELEPHCAGVKAIHVPEAGIVDFVQVCEKLVELVEQRGGRFIPSAKVTGMRRDGDWLVLDTSAGTFASGYLVNCAGLQCDRVTRLTGETPEAKILPFRGEYFELLPEAEHLCRNLIYPVPDPSFPFLGVHFTRMIHGGIECGPNAVLAFSREGYGKCDVNVRDLAESLSYTGFLRMGLRYWKTGIGEMWRSVSKGAFVKALQRLMPEIRAEHLKPAPSGVRAQAVTRDGKLVDDFLFYEGDRVVNVGNAPSPAATASLNVGKLIVDRLARQLPGSG
jgi:L-2-hydroxyglutarate oxidase